MRRTLRLVAVGLSLVVVIPSCLRGKGSHDAGPAPAPAADGTALVKAPVAPAADVVVASPDSSSLDSAAPSRTWPDSSALPPEASPPHFYRRETIPSRPARRIVLNELKLMWMALDALEEKEWSGAWGDPLPLQPGDFDRAELRAMVADEERKGRELAIPQEWESLFVGPEAAEEVQAEVLEARAEYVAFLREWQVREDYLGELDRVLPGDLERMVYEADNDPDADPTATEPFTVSEEPFVQDDSRLQLAIHGADLWNGTDLCREARLLGPEPDAGEVGAREAWRRGCRDIAVRQTVYHELTHALQHAYVNLHLPPERRDVKASWTDATKTLMDVERAYFWRWGGHEAVAEVANHAMAGERQADGVSYQVLVWACDFGAAQAAAAWDHWFGRLEDAAALLMRIRDRFERQWPEYPEDDFGGALFDVYALDSPLPEAQGVRDMALKLGALPAYVGYMQPMPPEESAGFWTALRED